MWKKNKMLPNAIKLSGQQYSHSRETDSRQQFVKQWSSDDCLMCHKFHLIQSIVSHYKGEEMDLNIFLHTKLLAEFSSMHTNHQSNLSPISLCLCEANVVNKPAAVHRTKSTFISWLQFLPVACWAIAVLQLCYFSRFSYTTKQRRARRFFIFAKYVVSKFS